MNLWNIYVHIFLEVEFLGFFLESRMTAVEVFKNLPPHVTLCFCILKRQASFSRRATVGQNKKRLYVVWFVIFHKGEPSCGPITT